jgi:hypothetical protein
MGKPSRTRPSAWWKGHGGAKRARPDRNGKPLAELLAEWSSARPAAGEWRGEDDAEAGSASPEPEAEAAPGHVAEAETEPAAAPKAEAEPKPEPVAEAEAAPVAEPEPEAELAPEPEPGPEPEPEADHPEPAAQQAVPDNLTAPSWGTVLANTLRLWLKRRGLRRAGQDAVPRPAWRRLGLLVLVLVVFAAGAVTVALIGRTTPASPDSSAGAVSRSLKAAAAVRGDAANWVIRQVSRGAIVACDPVMCATLEARGFPSGSLLTLGPSAGDPLGSAVVVATAAVRSQFGSRLTSEYAPIAIAGFGSGTDRVEVLVTATDGATAYLSDLRADQRARRLDSAQLLRGGGIKCSAPARAELVAGRVDARLLITLAAIASQQRVHILAFGGAAAGASPGVPLRTAELASPAGPSGRRYVRSMLAFLRAQRAPYLASTITTARLASGRTVLLVGFSAPSPLGLLGASTPGTHVKKSSHKAKKSSHKKRLRHKKHSEPGK